MSILNKIRKITKRYESLSEEEIREYEESNRPDKMESVISEVGESVSKPTPKTLIKLLLGALLITALVVFVSGVIKYNQLSERREILKEEVQALEDEIEELQYLIGISSDNNEYIIRIARKKLNLHFPDEIVYYNNVNE